jgi:predicted RNA binding protein YcfA (HicA-like mRNA interferase family)
MGHRDLFKRVTEILKSNDFDLVRSHGGHFFYRKGDKQLNVCLGWCDKHLAEKALKRVGLRLEL